MISLVVYDTKAANLLELTEYEEAARDAAMEALRRTQERLIDKLGDIEVAMFEGESLATLEQTHSRYFKSLKELGESLSDAARKSA